MREVEMSEATQLILGADTFCSDGACGEITRVVLDRVTRVVSHLVVEPKHRQGLGRMISWVLLDASTAGILLKCTSAEFDAFDHAEETVFLPGTGGRAAYFAGHPLPQPYDGLVDVIGEVPQPVTYDTIPQGEVELRSEELVEATNGEIAGFGAWTSIGAAATWCTYSFTKVTCGDAGNLPFPSKTLR
jgi:hypothetical protein